MIIFTSILSYLTSQGNNTNVAELKVHYLQHPGSITSVQELCSVTDCINPDVIHTNQLYFNTSTLFPEGLDKKKATKTCLTAKCTTEAYRIMKNMNRKVHPCHDFYNYACGTFIKETELVFDDIKDTFYNHMRKELGNELVNVLLENLDNSAPQRFKPAKILFDACLNEDAKYNLGKEPLMKLLEHLGGWPVLMGDKWNETAFSWDDNVYRCRKLGCPIHYLVNIGSQVQDGKQYVSVGPPIFTLELDLYKHDVSVNTYKDIMFQVAYAFEKGDNNTIRRDLQQSLDFEIKLATYASSSDGDYYRISDLEQSLPKFPWLKYLKTILAPHHTVTKNDILFVQDLEYFHKLSDLLEVTPKLVQANYLMWRVVINGIRYLTKYYEKLWLELTWLNYQTEGVDEKYICLTMVEKLVPLSLGYLFAKRININKKAKDKIIEIVDDIKDALRKVLLEATWVTKESRNKIMEKLNSMLTYIAYPNDLSTTATDQFYSNLSLSSDKYFDAVLQLTALQNEFLIKKPWETTKDVRCSLRMEDSLVTYYNCDNSLELPTGLLRGIVFSAYRPTYLNYGFLGFLIGVEILHGLSNKPVVHEYETIFREHLFSLNAAENAMTYFAHVSGVLVQGVMSLWQDEHVFEQISSCFQYRYSEMTIDQLAMKYNGSLSKVNNVIDNVAMQLAYRAYEAWIKRNVQEQILPGFENHTPKQMFWLSIAHGFCSKYSNDRMNLLIDHGRTPPKIRFNGVASNLREFSIDYSCALNSEMNPEEKCPSW